MRRQLFSPNEEDELATQKRFRYKEVALGGTFDKFHLGHEDLISAAFQIGHKVLIGVTSDSFARTLGKHHTVQPYASRVRTLMKFLRAKRWVSRAVIAPLHDPYGPAARRCDIEALVITPDTLASAKKLNRLRTQKALSALKIHKVSISRAEDGGPISSTRIRKREIDRGGRVVRR